MREVPSRKLTRDRYGRPADTYFSLFALAILVLLSPVLMMPLYMAGHYSFEGIGVTVVALLNLGVMYLGVVALRRRWAILRQPEDR